MFCKNKKQMKLNVSVLMGKVSLKYKFAFLFLMSIFIVMFLSVYLLSGKYQYVKESERLLAEFNFILPYHDLITSLGSQRGLVAASFYGEVDQIKLNNAIKKVELDRANLPVYIKDIHGGYEASIKNIDFLFQELGAAKEKAFLRTGDEELQKKIFDYHSSIIEEIHNLIVILSFNVSQSTPYVSKFLVNWVELEKLKEYFAIERGLRHILYFKIDPPSQFFRTLSFYMHIQKEIMGEMFHQEIQNPYFIEDLEIKEDVYAISSDKWWELSSKRVSVVDDEISFIINDIQNKLNDYIKKLKQQTLFYSVFLLILLSFVFSLSWLIIRQFMKQVNVLDHNIKLIDVENIEINSNLVLKNPIGDDEIAKIIFKLNNLILENRASVINLALFKAIVLNVKQMISVADKDEKIIFVNKSFEDFYEYPLKELIGKNHCMFRRGGAAECDCKKMHSDIKNKLSHQSIVWDKNKSGEEFPVETSIVVLKDAQGCVSNYIRVSSDITKRLSDERKIWKQANVDALTGLYNRQYLISSLKKDMEIAKRENNFLAVLFIDLDGFKLINDTQGHEAGDLLLKHVAQKLKVNSRKTDTVARLGGDELVMVLPLLEDTSLVSRIALKILKDISSPVKINNIKVSISSSIGVSIFSSQEPDMSFDKLIQQADTAMYKAKELGKNRVEFYEEGMHQSILNMVETHEQLLLAVKNNELRLHYQPVIDMKVKKVIGVEALVRWQHPQKGLVFPDNFIGISEEMGSIIPMGDWVINEAFKQGLEWKETDLFGKGNDFSITVNVSSRQCMDDFKNLLKTLRKVKEKIDLLGIDNFLQIEVTESMLFSDSENLIARFNEIKDLGFKLLIDDFGTGYSSLSYLKKFPIDKLKVDKAFIKNLEKDKENRSLVEAIIYMSHALNIEVVAEGVEEEFDKDLLTKFNCEYAQGYYYSKPLPSDEFRRYLVENK